MEEEKQPDISATINWIKNLKTEYWIIFLLLIILAYMISYSWQQQATLESFLVFIQNKGCMMTLG